LESRELPRSRERCPGAAKRKSEKNNNNAYRYRSSESAERPAGKEPRKL